MTYSASPTTYDVILGGQVTCMTHSAILGGIEGVRQRLNHTSIERRLAALPSALQYRREGMQLLADTLKKDDSWQVRRAAFWLLQKSDPRLQQFLQNYNPYRAFAPRYTIALSETTGHPGADFVNAMAIAQNGQVLAASSSRHIQIRHFGSGTLLQTIPDYGAIALSPDGQTLYSGSGSYDGTINAWQWQTDLQHVTVGQARGVEVDSLALSPNGEHLVTSSGYQGKLKVWQIRNRQLLYTGNGFKPVVMNPNGQQFISGSKDGSIKIWSLRCGSVLRTIETQGGGATAIAISPDGKTLAGGSSNGAIYLWNNLLKGDLRHILRHSTTAPVTAIAVSPDGNALASGCYRGTVKVWNLHTGDLLWTTAATDSISTLTFAPDGSALAVGCWDARVSVWAAA